MIRPSWLSEEWDGAVHVKFGPPEFGWVTLWLSTPAIGQATAIDISDVFPPFDDLLAWLHAVLDLRLPATLTIDEEGVYSSLLALDAECKEDVVEFAVIHHEVRALGWDPEPALRCRVSRIGLVREFTYRLEQWIAEVCDPEDFGDLPSREPGDPLHPEDLRRLDFGTLGHACRAGATNWPRRPAAAMRSSRPLRRQPQREYSFTCSFSSGSR